MQTIWIWDEGISSIRVQNTFSKLQIESRTHYTHLCINPTNSEFELKKLISFSLHEVEVWGYTQIIFLGIIFILGKTQFSYVLQPEKSNQRLSGRASERWMRGEYTYKKDDFQYCDCSAVVLWKKREIIPLHC